jgi:hypothetical protein
MSADASVAPFDRLVDMGSTQTADLTRLRRVALGDALGSSLEHLLSGQDGADASPACRGDWLLIVASLVLLLAQALAPPVACPARRRRGARGRAKLGRGGLAAGLSMRDKREARDGLDLLYALERAWFEARRDVAGRRKASHDARAVDVLAAAPVLSATTLVRILDIAIKTGIRWPGGLGRAVRARTDCPAAAHSGRASALRTVVDGMGGTGANIALIAPKSHWTAYVSP